MNKLELTGTQISKILEYTIKNNIQLANKGIIPKALGIEGEPGIAKTSVVSQTVATLGNDFYYVKINPAEMEVPDVIGYPVTEIKVCKENECKWVTKESLNNFLLQGYEATGNHRMTYSIPSWIEGKTDKPVVLNLDDYNRTTPMMLQALMNVMLEQKYVSWELPKGSTVICTSNPENGDFLVSTSDKAQKTRMLQLYMKADVDSWALWATNNVKECFINFIEQNKEIIENTNNDTNIEKGTLRSWTDYFQTIESIAIDTDNEGKLNDNWFNIAYPLGAGSLPEEHLIMLSQFLSKRLDKIPSIHDVLHSENIENVLKELIKLTKDRQDIASMLGKRTYNYCIVNYKNFTPAMISNLHKLLETDNILTQDQYRLVCTKLALSEYNKVFNLMKNQTLLNKIIN